MSLGRAHVIDGIANTGAHTFVENNKIFQGTIDIHLHVHSHSMRHSLNALDTIWPQLWDPSHKVTLLRQVAKDCHVNVVLALSKDHT
jgi:hypothetical protein